MDIPQDMADPTKHTLKKVINNHYAVVVREKSANLVFTNVSEGTRGGGKCSMMEQDLKEL